MMVPLVDAAGSDYEIGFQCGSALQAQRDRLLATIDRQLSQVDLRRRPEADRRRDAISELLARHSPATIAQLDGIAAALDIAPMLLLRWVMAGYLYAELNADRPDLPVDGCTVWGASGDAAGEGGPLLVKNRDQPPDSLPLQLVLRARPIGRMSWAAVTTMGAPGVHSSGMNAAGLAIADTHVPSRDLGLGVPRFSLMLHVLEEHETVASALAYLASVPMMGGGNLVLADADGTLGVVECGHLARALSSRQSGTVQATNHFVSAVLEDAYGLDAGSEATASSRGRYSLVHKTLAQRAGAVTPAFARDLMAHHGDLCDTVCRHGSEAHPSQSISCVIFQPLARTLEICHGNPCDANYRTISVTATAG